MGFYAPAQLVRDARVLPPDINESDWESDIFPDLPVGRNLESAAVRLGFQQIKGLSEDEATHLQALREACGGAFRTIDDLQELGRASLEKLARADAFRSIGLDRRAALWAVRGLDDASPLPLLEDARRDEEAVQLPLMGLGEHVADDYRTMRLSLKAHPLSLLREDLGADGYGICADLETTPDGARVAIAGLVVTRQRPGSAKGVMFITLEDETGHANLVVWSTVLERFRAEALASNLIGVRGTLQREGQVIHMVAEQLINETLRLRLLDDPLSGSVPVAPKSRNFH